MKKTLLLSCLCLFTACFSSRPFVQPEVSVVNMVFEGITLFETTALFTVRVDNVNPYDLEVDGAVHRLYLNDVYVGKGFDRAGFNIPRLSTKTQQVKVHISNLSLAAKMHSLINKNKLSFKIESTLYPKGVGARKVTVFDSGSLDFEGLEKGGARFFSRVGMEAKPSSQPASAF